MCIAKSPSQIKYKVSDRNIKGPKFNYFGQQLKVLIWSVTKFKNKNKIKYKNNRDLKIN